METAGSYIEGYREPGGAVFLPAFGRSSPRGLAGGAPSACRSGTSRLGAAQPLPATHDRRAEPSRGEHPGHSAVDRGSHRSDGRAGPPAVSSARPRDREPSSGKLRASTRRGAAGWVSTGHPQGPNQKNSDEGGELRLSVPFTDAPTFDVSKFEELAPGRARGNPPEHRTRLAAVAIQLAIAHHRHLPARCWTTSRDGHEDVRCAGRAINGTAAGGFPRSRRREFAVGLSGPGMRRSIKMKFCVPSSIIISLVSASAASAMIDHYEYRVAQENAQTGLTRGCPPAPAEQAWWGKGRTDPCGVADHLSFSSQPK
jgi:hypothetical protein